MWRCAIELKLYPHQEVALGEMKNGCILRGGVGTGKSITALAYFYTQVVDGELGGGALETWGVPRKPRDLYIITTAKKRDSFEWQKDALLFQLSTSAELSIAGIRLVVDSWNNVENYVDVKDAFFIFDEQRAVGSGVWAKSLVKIAKSNEWVLLSATPGDNWMDYVPVFVANGYYKNRTEFIRRHVVYKNFAKFPIISHYIETGTLQKLRYRLLVDMPYVRHTVRHVEYLDVDYDKELFDKVWKDRWHIYEDRPLRDVGEMFSVARKLVNSDQSRLRTLRQLSEKHPRLIVFYNFNYELDALREMVSQIQSEEKSSQKKHSAAPASSTSLTSTTTNSSTSTGFEVREWNGQKHQAIPEGDRWIYLVQYTAGAEGWNCIATDAEVFFSLNYSWKMSEQAKGRIDRLNTPYTDLHYFILRSRSPIDQAIMRSLDMKEEFNEKAFFNSLEWDLAA